MMRAVLFFPILTLAIAHTPLYAQDSVQPAVAESTARRIVIERIHGSTVRAEHLEQHDGRLTYTYEVAVTGQSNDVVVHVDAADGRVLDITPTHGRGDSAATADVIRKESSLKDTAAMPPNTLKDTTAGRTRDSTAPKNPPPPPPH
ncbi:MAG TPA: PepSY domain-containing protein [Gemmatimonadaceae bacterium]|jgi:hypothetical protein|nr:PepSY domain-containing protein [Gemmatimonadaceae bacterium]